MFAAKMCKNAIIAYQKRGRATSTENRPLSPIIFILPKARTEEGDNNNEPLVPSRMNILIVCLFTLIILSAAWLLYRTFYVKRKFKKLTEAKLKIFHDLIKKLTAKETIHDEDLESLAENPSTRHALFGILETFGKAGLFPQEYYTMEKSAESFMVNWLEFPTELNGTPDQIEIFTKVTLTEDHENLEYFVFKYKKQPPPPGLSKGWMLGVTGPFGSESKPYQIPLRVFSRFNELGTVSAIEEVRWVHGHISRKP
jgi:hypothetical protein